MVNNAEGSVRVLHAVPADLRVDVYAGRQQIAKNLSFGAISDYVSLPVGNHEIQVYAAGTTTTPVLRNMLMVEPNSIHTIAITGTPDTVGLLAISDRMDRMEQRRSMVRFCHLSPNAPAVDITLSDGTPLFRNVSYKQITQYLMVDPMNYTLQVRLAGTPTVVLTVPNVNLRPGMSYTIYAIGLVGEDPELSALLVTDGV